MAVATARPVSTFLQSRPTQATAGPVLPGDQPYIAGPQRAQEWLQHHVPAVVDLG